MGAPLIEGETIAHMCARAWWCCGGLFADWVEPLRNGVAELMADPGPFERTVQPQDGSAPFFQDLCNWQRIASFREFVCIRARLKPRRC